jgi:hypothetical protein
LSITGSLELDASLANGHTATATGRYQDKIIDVILDDKAADGILRRFHIQWNALGKLLKQEKAD